MHEPDPVVKPRGVMPEGATTLPARYYVALLQTVFLAGDVWPIILPNTAVLAGMAALLLVLNRGATRKTLD